MPEDVVGGHIELKLLSYNAFQTLRSKYMNINIRPGIVDGKLCRVYAFSASPTLSNWDTHINMSTIYLLSDFLVEPVDYDRMAKLVLYAALSKESTLIAKNNALDEDWAKDIVLSNACYRQKDQINDGARMGDWMLAEAQPTDREKGE